MITKEILIEDLIRKVPNSVAFLMKKGIKCIACGEPIWGTLEEAAREKGMSTGQIEQIVKELQMLNKDS
jgi:methionine synthase II (cobalamin-independent)